MLLRFHAARIQTIGPVPWIKIDTIVDISLAVARRHLALGHTSHLITGAQQTNLKFELS
jgi:hypothetical protein